MGYRLGVDLGTSFTAAAYIDDAGPRMLELGNRNVTAPSVVFLAEDGRMLFGETAERRASAEPERVLREFKRRVGDTVPMVVGSRSFDPVTLQARLLAWVLRTANDQLAGPPDHVVVTHPANWGLFKIQQMRGIVVAAGIPDASLCPEPVAAAIEYAAKERVPVGAKIAVYDLGGGTFDVAVLEKVDDGFTITGTPLGVDHLGGSDFDEAVLADAASKLGLHGLDPDDAANARGLAALRRDCVEAKEALSSDVTTDVTSLLPGSSHSVRLTRAELEELIRPALEESIRTTVRALKLAGIENRELHAVVLVGGSSRIPLVTELLNREIGVRVASDTFPKHDVALGAARFARLQVPAPVESVTGGGASIGSLQGASAESSEEAATVVPRPSSSALTPAPTTPPGLESAIMQRATTAPHIDQGAPVRGPEVLDSLPIGGLGLPTPVESEQSARRIPVALILAITIICVGVGAGVVAYRAWLQTEGQAGPTSQSSGTRGGQPSQEGTDQSALNLPVGVPLPETQLVVPRYMKSGAPSQLWVIDSVRPQDSRHLDALQDGSAFGIGMSRDRRTMTYIDGGANAVRAMPASGGSGRRLFASPDGCGNIEHASWSPTDLAVFVLECRLDSGPRRLAVVGLDGTTTRELDTGKRNSSDPTVSPDGTEVAFWATDESNNDGGAIFVMPIDGFAPPRRLTDGKVGMDSDPAWSPDGDTVAFRRSIGDPDVGDAQIMVVSVEDGTQRTLIDGSAANEKPTWSPDGHTLVFVSNRDSNGSRTDRQDLWLVPADGGTPTALGLGAHDYAAPTWWHR